MNKYYYHGVGDMVIEELLDLILKIISDGEIKTRSGVRPNLSSEYNHICLYKKNDDIDYSDEKDYGGSARSGWIDHCFFFIISPDIEARKVKVSNNTTITDDGELCTNIVDEWRTDGAIPISKIKGIALPFDTIEEERTYLKDSFFEKLAKIIDIATEYGWMVENSDEEDLCDRLDSELEEKNINK